MAGRNFVVEFILNLSRWRPGARELVRTTDQISQKTTQASQSQAQFQSAVQKSGDQAAATAVRFQTMTQGMLNLTTAGAQTFTSFSNLDRAGNRFAMSTIAVARANDLLSAKQLRLSDQMKKDIPNLGKVAQLKQEIATATADLTVKIDKQKIEEGALLDIQILFATNIANVMISSIQTITTLRQAQILTTIKHTFVTRILNKVIISNVGANRLAIGNQLILTNAQRAGTFTVRGLTIATRGLLLTLGPIAIIIGGIAAAMAIWEHNIFGIRTALEEIGGPFKDQSILQKEVLEDTMKLNEETQNLGDTYKDEFPKSLLEAIAALRAYQVELRSVRKTQKEFFRTGVAKVDDSQQIIDFDFRGASRFGKDFQTASNQTGFQGGVKIPSNLPGFLIPLFLAAARERRIDAGQLPIQNAQKISILAKIVGGFIQFENRELLVKGARAIALGPEAERLLGNIVTEGFDFNIPSFQTPFGPSEFLIQQKGNIVPSQFADGFSQLSPATQKAILRGKSFPDERLSTINSRLRDIQIRIFRNTSGGVVNATQVEELVKELKARGRIVNGIPVDVLDKDGNIEIPAAETMNMIVAAKAIASHRIKAFDFGTNTGSGFGFRATQFAPLGQSSFLGGDAATIQKNLLLTGQFNASRAGKLLDVGGSLFLQEASRLIDKGISGLRPIGDTLFPPEGTSLTTKELAAFKRSLGLGGFRIESINEFVLGSTITQTHQGSTRSANNFNNPFFSEGVSSGGGVGPNLETMIATKLRDARANLFRDVFGFGGFRQRTQTDTGFLNVLPDDLAALATVAHNKAVQLILDFSPGNSGWDNRIRLRRLKNRLTSSTATFFKEFDVRIDSAFSRFSPDLDLLTKNQVRNELIKNNDADIFGDRIRWNNFLASATTGEV